MLEKYSLCDLCLKAVGSTNFGTTLDKNEFLIQNLIQNNVCNYTARCSNVVDILEKPIGFLKWSSTCQELKDKTSSKNAGKTCRIDKYFL